MTKLSFFLASMWRVVVVGLAVGAVAAIIPYGPASAAPDDDAPANEASIPWGTTISYGGDDGVVLISMPFNLGIAGRLPVSEAIVTLQVQQRFCHTCSPFPGATKNGTSMQRGPDSYAGSLATA
jgi:hypothetical protein